MTKIKCILTKEMRLLMTMTRRWCKFESNLPRAWTHAANSNKAKRPIVRYCHMMISASYPDRSQLPSLYILPPTSVARSFLKHRLFLNVDRIEKQQEQKMRRMRSQGEGNRWIYLSWTGYGSVIADLLTLVYPAIDINELVLLCCYITQNNVKQIYPKTKRESLVVLRINI